MVPVPGKIPDPNPPRQPMATRNQRANHPCQEIVRNKTSSRRILSRKALIPPVRKSRPPGSNPADPPSADKAVRRILPETGRRRRSKTIRRKTPRLLPRDRAGTIRTGRPAGAPALAAPRGEISSIEVVLKEGPKAAV